MTSQSKGREEVQTGVTTCDVGRVGGLSVVTSRKAFFIPIIV